MSAEKSEVFISFAYKDGLSVAQELDARLQAEGISTWFERNDMKGGDDWKAKSSLHLTRFGFSFWSLPRRHKTPSG